MTAIQENNYKLINTKQLFEDFCSSSENLDTEFGDLRLSSDCIYSPKNEVFKDITIIDMAIDRSDTLYIVDKEKKIYTYHPNENILQKIGVPGESIPLELNTISAIGVDKDTIYIADYISETPRNQTGQNSARLIAFTKRDFQIRWIHSTGAHGFPLNRIHTIQCDNRGKVYVIEENPVEKGENKKFCVNKILYMNTFDICSHPFLPYNIVGDENLTPLKLTIDTDGFLYILFEKYLDNNKGASKENGIKEYILKVLPTRKDSSVLPVEHKIPVRFSPLAIAVGASKQIYISGYDPSSGVTICKLPKGAVDTWTPLRIHKLSYETPEIPEGSGTKLIGDSKGNLYVINNKNELTLLIPKKLNLQDKKDKKDKKGYFEGTYISKPIDSQDEKTRWHRILLEGEFGSGTQVDFQYYISDEKLSDEIIKSEFIKWNNCVSKATAIQGDKKRDALFLEDIQGRYLLFKLILSGNETLSPVVKSVTVFFPRVSYLDYLPAIYQEDSISKELLERFLAVFESIVYEIDFKIDHIGRFFDTHAAPPEFLSWLGSWLALSMDEDWPEDKKRLFIRNAVSLYKKKGTRKGLEESIELFTGEKPFIVERFQASKECTDSISQHNKKKLISSPSQKKLVSSPSQEQIFFPYTVKKCPENETEGNKDEEELLINRLYGSGRFSFCVLLKDTDLDKATQNRVKRIIEEQRPAHTSYELKVLEPWFSLDRHTYLEINTVVTEPKFILEKTSMVGRDTILDDEEIAGQIERHSRTGIDTLLS